MAEDMNEAMVAETPVFAPAKPAKAPRPLRPALPADKQGWWWGTGRRKSAVARVRLRPAKDGAGTILIQVGKATTKTIEQYFSEDRDRADCTSALKLTDTFGKVNVIAKCHGGGYMGQAGAVRLGIARALRDYDPTLEAALRVAGFLTRDAREVERKKYGQAGARRRFQFSKR